MFRIKTTIAGLALAAATFASSANAAVYEQKFLHFNGPESQVSDQCANWAIYHEPEVYGFPPQVRMVERRRCIGHSYKFMNHELFFVVDGPAPEEAVRQIVTDAAKTAVIAGITAAAATPGEAAIKASAGLAAAKIALYASLTGNALSKAFADKYSINVEDRKSW